MPARSSILSLLAATAALAIASGCGSDGDTDSDPTISEAKATLSKDCQQGKASDKPLCDCIADKLQAAGNDAKQILALNKRVNDGNAVPVVTKAAGQCSKFAAP